MENDLPPYIVLGATARHIFGILFVDAAVPQHIIYTSSSIAIGAFRSSLLFRLLDVAPSQVRFVVDRLLCFLIVDIQASGISIPLSLLMLLG